METTVSCRLIRPGRYQPRRYFDEFALDQLAKTIKSVGLISPIVIRPVEEGQYEIVAGERRWRAFQIAFGSESEIPADVKQLSDEQAHAMALVENIQREPMSPTEEAASAHELLLIIKNKEEVADQLGWTTSKLEKRLALMRCISEVRDALDHRQIKIGHAELLASLTGEMQAKILAGILAHSVSVESLHKQLASFAQDLNAAVFDLQSCLTCQYNSAQQSALFAENIGEGRCTHPTCFQEKTQQHLEKLLADLQQEVPRAELLAAGDEKIIPIRLIADGATGVGQAQYETCRSCANYGATISSAPGQVGQVDRDICFDGDCHTLKVAAHIKAKQAVAKPAASAGTKSAASSRSSESSAAVADVARASSPAPSVAKVSQRIQDYAEVVWRYAVSSYLMNNESASHRFLIWLALSGNLRELHSAKFIEKVKKLTGVTYSSTVSVDDALGLIKDIDDEKEKLLLRLLPSYTLPNLDIRHVKGLLKYFDIRLSDYWSTTAKYLDLLTKVEIEAFCKESGLTEVFGESYKSVMSGKKPEIVAAVMAHSEKHLVGFVPMNLAFDR